MYYGHARDPKYTGLNNRSDEMINPISEWVLFRPGPYLLWNERHKRWQVLDFRYQPKEGTYDEKL